MLERRRLVIIDDEPEITALFKDQLDELGIDIAAFTSSEDALKYLRTNPVHAVLSDIMMPRMNGFKLLEEIRMIHPELPVLFITGNPTSDGLLKALQLKSVDYLTKPVAREALCVAVAKAVDIGSRLESLHSTLKTLEEKHPDSRKEIQKIRRHTKQISLLKINQS
jgi:DNA-binding NtrC family response regulator